MSFKSKLFTIAILVIGVFLLSSCVTQRSVEYMQDKDKKVKEFNNDEFKEYKLKPNDELYIQISSLDEAAASVFANNNKQIYGSMDPYSASLLSHTIDKEGYLDLPVVGKLLVKDKTIPEVSSLLKNALVNILNQPIVSVKLVNRFISVLGEVKNPGHFSFSQEKLTIFDAVGMAGDINEYGNRTNVILLRNENGKNIRVNLNLTKSEILTSPYFFLRPNDVVYVKPLRRKFWGMREFPFSVILSSITAAILVLSYVNNK